MLPHPLQAVSGLCIRGGVQSSLPTCHSVHGSRLCALDAYVRWGKLLWLHIATHQRVMFNATD
jgi:hypothetical protein